MASNAFNTSNPLPNPPAVCHYRDPPLPIIPPGFPAPAMQAYGRWTDLDPLAPIDVAVYIPLAQLGAGWVWRGSITKGAVKFQITVSRLIAPQPWALQLDVWDPWRNPETTIWTPIVMQLEPSWDTGMQRSIYLPGLDFREARAQQ